MARDLPGLEPGHVVPLGARRRDVGYAWVNGVGLIGHDIPDADDFVLSLAPKGPPGTCARSSTRSFPTASPPAGTTAHARSGRWRAPGTSCRQAGVRTRRGSSAATSRASRPGSTASAARRQCDLPDPDLPGDEHPVRRDVLRPRRPAARRRRGAGLMTDAAHRRSMRVIGDLTLNHVGVAHLVYRCLGEPRRRPSANSSTSTTPCRTGTVLARDSHPAEARLEFAGLRAAMAAVTRHWLSRPSSSTAGASTSPTWSAATGELGLTADVAGVRAALATEPDAVLIAEHGHDYRDDLLGDGWPAMNYAGLLRPAWTWLRGHRVTRSSSARSGASRSACHCRALRPSPPCARSAPACRGRASTRGRCSTATTRRASAPSRLAGSGNGRDRAQLRRPACRWSSCRRRDRARGRLGRGRSSDDAVGAPRDLGHRAARGVSR